jgi:hypothetical protein
MEEHVPLPSRQGAQRSSDDEQRFRPLKLALGRSGQRLAKVEPVGELLE